MWRTRIFQSADGSEKRSASIATPNYKIRYNFLVDLLNKPILDTIHRHAETVTWVVPLAYQLRRLAVSFTARRSPFFPVYNYVALVHPNAGNIVYKRLTDGFSPQASQLSFRSPLTAAQRALLDPVDVWMCPVVEADLSAEITTTSVGESREGDTVEMEWR